MSATTLLLASAINAVVAVSFIVVGRAVLRQNSGATHGALPSLAVWWWALGAYLLVQSALLVDGALRGSSLPLYLASRVLATPLLCAAAGCLTYYMLYLFTGRHGLRIPVFVLYFATTVVFFVATFMPAPTGVLVTDWMIRGNSPEGPLDRIVYALVGIPPIASGIALLAAAHRLETPQRYRATLVAIGILAYVGSGLAAFLGTSATFQFVALTGMGLLASACVLMAYHPPNTVRNRLGLGDVQPPAQNDKRDKRTLDVRERCAELV